MNTGNVVHRFLWESSARDIVPCWAIYDYADRKCWDIFDEVDNVGWTIAHIPWRFVNEPEKPLSRRRNVRPLD